MMRTMQHQKNAESRRKEIARMVASGKTLREIGEKFHISRGRVHQLYEREKEVNTRDCCRGMDIALFNLVKRAIGADTLTLADITNFVQKPDWKALFMRSKGIGPKRLEEFEAFCRGKGILKG